MATVEVLMMSYTPGTVLLGGMSSAAMQPIELCLSPAQCSWELI